MPFAHFHSQCPSLLDRGIIALQMLILVPVQLLTCRIKLIEQHPPILPHSLGRATFCSGGAVRIQWVGISFEYYFIYHTVGV